MNKTIALAEVLDAQLTILRINGFESEYQIYEYSESEIQEEKCELCDGEGKNYLDEPIWDDYYGDFMDYRDCNQCDGTGAVLVHVMNTYKETEFMSNIVI